MWENNQKPDEKPHRSSEISQTVQIYRNTLNTQSGKFQNWEEGHFILFFLTLTSPLAWTVKSWSIMGVNSVPSCLQQTRLITKTLMQCSNLFGAALRLCLFHPSLGLTWRAAKIAHYCCRGDYIYGARDKDVRVET